MSKAVKLGSSEYKIRRMPTSCSTQTIPKGPDVFISVILIFTQCQDQFSASMLVTTNLFLSLPALSTFNHKPVIPGLYNFLSRFKRQGEIVCCQDTTLT